MTALADRIRAIWSDEGPCGEAIDWLESLAPDVSDQQAWEACERSDWMLELLTITEPDPARFRLCACAIARTALRFIPEGEDRPRIAIETSERYARGEATDEELDAARAAAWDAARAAAWDAARAAALREQAAIVREWFPEAPRVPSLVEA